MVVHHSTLCQLCVSPLATVNAPRLHARRSMERTSDNAAVCDLFRRINNILEVTLIEPPQILSNNLPLSPRRMKLSEYDVSDRFPSKGCLRHSAGDCGVSVNPSSYPFDMIREFVQSQIFSPYSRGRCRGVAEKPHRHAKQRRLQTLKIRAVDQQDHGLHLLRKRSLIRYCHESPKQLKQCNFHHRNRNPPPLSLTTPVKSKRENLGEKNEKQRGVHAVQKSPKEQTRLAASANPIQEDLDRIPDSQGRLHPIREDLTERTVPTPPLVPHLGSSIQEVRGDLRATQGTVLEQIKVLHPTQEKLTEQTRLMPALH